MAAASDHDLSDPTEFSRRVFISHSSKDRELAYHLCVLLEERGLKCWIAPRDVSPGENYGSQIVHGLQDSDDLAVLLSPDSLESRHVASEVARAFEKGKNIYPLRLKEDVWPTEELELFVTSAHWVELWSRGIDKAADELVEAIKARASSKVRPGTPVGTPARKPRPVAPIVTMVLLCFVLAILIPFYLVLRDPEKGEALAKRLPPGLQGLASAIRGEEIVVPPPPDPVMPPGKAVPVETQAPPAKVEPPFGKRLWESLSSAIDFIWVDALGMWVSKFEITNVQYRQFNAEHWSGRFQGERLDGNPQPVVMVSHRDAVEFPMWLTENDREAGHIEQRGWHYRLPTEKEWMRFAACGEERLYPWGNSWPPKRGNYADKTLADRPWAERYIDSYNDTHRVTCAVYESGKNEWGLYGVGGNVWEWMLEPVAGQGVVRGGAWDRSVPEHLTCEIRVEKELTERSPAIGFRLVFAPRGSGPMRPPPHMRPGMRRGPQQDGVGPPGDGERRRPPQRRMLNER